jgi:hypothetical protein
LYFLNQYSASVAGRHSTKYPICGNTGSLAAIFRNFHLPFMKLLLTISLTIMFCSCKTNMKSDASAKSQISDTLKLPKDSLSFYFPVNIFYDQHRRDSFVQNWYSSTLYSFKEPVLYQNFIGHNIYRFLWLRSFQQPVVISLHKSDGQVWLNTKMLDKQPRFLDERVCCFSKEEKEEYIKEGYSVDSKRPDLMIRIADRKANITFNKNVSLSNSEWIEFENLLAKADFWKLPTSIDEESTDGSQWIIEGHFMNKYHVVDYFSPVENEYAKAGRFLIKLSGLQEEVY